jgi:hypothetical protein
MEMKYF